MFAVLSCAATMSASPGSIRRCTSAARCDRDDDSAEGAKAAAQEAHARTARQRTIVVVGGVVWARCAATGEAVAGPSAAARHARGLSSARRAIEASAPSRAVAG